VTRTLRVVLLALATLALFAGAACGDDGDGTSAPAPVDGDSDADDGTAEDGPTDEGSGDAPTGGGGGGGGSLIFGDETITLDRALCYLQEQPVAGSEGTIELTAQGHGTNAAGESVVVDFTRFGEDSLFAGDDITIDIGDPRGDDFMEYGAVLDIGGVLVDGTVVTATDVPFAGDDGTQIVGSFRIEC
jgi:hypothetical protein